MKFQQKVLFGFAFILLIILVACSGNSTTPSNSSIGVVISSPPSSLQENATATLTAVITNDAQNAGVTWSCIPANACGSFSPTTSSGSSATTTYTAPATAGSVTITATSVTDFTKSATATINITAATITVSVSAPSSLGVNQSGQVTATITNDPSAAGVSWSCTPNIPTGACGTFSSQSGTGNTVTTTYTAPAAIPTPNPVTIIATSKANTNVTGSTTIRIGQPIVTLSPTPGTLAAGGKAAFAAIVQFDSSNQGVTWTATCGGTACGTLSSTSTASGVATDFTASGISAGSTLTITATLVSNTSISASATVNIVGPVTTLADGQYVFSVAGEDWFNSSGAVCSGVSDIACSPYFTAGAFKVSAGSIVGGEQDFIDVSSIDTQDAITGGSISTDATGNLLISLVTSSALGTETFSATMISATRARIIEFDGIATSSGTLDLQQSTITAPSGGYAFAVEGLDAGTSTSSPAPLGIGGVINVDGSETISGSGSVFDINDAGSVAQNQGLSASTVSGPGTDTFGRVVFTLNPASGSIPALSFVGYIVGPNHIRLVETTDSFGGTTGGEAFGQGSNAGGFSTASVSGTSFAFGTSGADVSGAFQVAGVLTTNSDGTVTGTLNANDLTFSGVQTPIPFTGTYTVDPTGRVTLSSLTGGGITITAQMYLSGLGNAVDVSGNGTAKIVSMDTTDVLAGSAYQQTGGGAFTATSFFGSYAMNATGFDFNNESEFDAVGPVSVDGVSAFTGTVDQNFMVPPTSTTQALPVGPAAFTAVPSGVFTGTITGLDVDTPANNDAFSYYMIDTTKAIAIETDGNQLTLIQFELQQ